MLGAPPADRAVRGIEGPIGDPPQQRKRLHLQQGQPVAPHLTDRGHRGTLGRRPAGQCGAADRHPGMHAQGRPQRGEHGQDAHHRVGTRGQAGEPQRAELQCAHNEDRMNARDQGRPGTHTHAGLISASKASSQITPRIVQSTFMVASAARRSSPIAVTAATATAIATAAWALLRSPACARGINHAAAASMPSHTTTGTTG